MPAAASSSWRAIQAWSPRTAAVRKIGCQPYQAEAGPSGLRPAVEVDVEVGRRAESLNEHDRAGIGGTSFQARLLEQKAREDAVNDASRRALGAWFMHRSAYSWWQPQTTQSSSKIPLHCARFALRLRSRMAVTYALRSHLPTVDNRLFFGHQQFEATNCSDCRLRLGSAQCRRRVARFGSNGKLRRPVRRTNMN